MHMCGYRINYYAVKLSCDVIMLVSQLECQTIIWIPVIKALGLVQRVMFYTVRSCMHTDSDYKVKLHSTVLTNDTSPCCNSWASQNEGRIGVYGSPGSDYRHSQTKWWSSQLSWARVFTKFLDAKYGFWQIPLAIINPLRFAWQLYVYYYTMAVSVLSTFFIYHWYVFAPNIRILEFLRCLDGVVYTSSATSSSVEHRY